MFMYLYISDENENIYLSTSKLSQYSRPHPAWLICIIYCEELLNNSGCLIVWKML